MGKKPISVKAYLATGAEDAVIREKRAEFWPSWKIAEHLTQLRGFRFNEDGVRRRARDINLPPGKPTTLRPKWEPSADDDEIIRFAWAGNLTLSAVRRRLGVTDTEIQHRAVELNLGKKVSYQASNALVSAVGGQQFASHEEFDEWLVKLYANRRYDDGRVEEDRPARHIPPMQ